MCNAHVQPFLSSVVGGSAGASAGGSAGGSACEKVKTLEIRLGDVLVQVSVEQRDAWQLR